MRGSKRPDFESQTLLLEGFCTRVRNLEFHELPSGTIIILIIIIIIIIITITINITMTITISTIMRYENKINEIS